MSVLVLGVLSYPSALPNLDQDITAFDFQQQLGNVAFADDEEEENGEEEEGEQEHEEEQEGEEEEEELDEEEEEEIELEGTITEILSNTSFKLRLENGTIITISTNVDTKFEDLEGLSDSILDFAVEVEIVLSNSSLVATEIELEEEEDEEYEEEYEIEVEVEYGVAKVEIEFDDHKYRFVQDFTDENSLAEAILIQVPDLPLSTSEIITSWDLDIEEEDEDVSYATIENQEEAMQTAQDMIYELQQKIEELENRIQTLLEKLESGEYFGTVPQVDPVINSYIISFEGSATSIDDDSIVIDADGEIFIENMLTTGDVSKFRVTGGEISIDNTFYDLIFGKARVSSFGPSGEKDSLVLIGQVIDFGDVTDDSSTLKLVIDSEMPLEGDFGLEPITIEILPQSKIAGQWYLSGSGELSLLEG